MFEVGLRSPLRSPSEEFESGLVVLLVAKEKALMYPVNKTRFDRLALSTARRGTVMAEYACVLAVVAALLIAVFSNVSANFPTPLPLDEASSIPEASPQFTDQSPLQVAKSPEASERLNLVEIGLLVATCVLAPRALRRIEGYIGR